MRILITGIIMLFTTQLFTQTKQNITSKIEKVIVFTNGAQINRTAKTNIETGKTEMVFTDISPYIDKQSIQVKGEGSFTIMSVGHQMNYLKVQAVSDEIQQLEKRKEELAEQITYNNSILNVYKQEQLLMEKNQSLSLIHI